MTFYRAPMPAFSSWYAEALRFLGTFLHAAADRLESPSIAPALLEPHPEIAHPEERVFQLRHRIQSQYY